MKPKPFPGNGRGLHVEFMRMREGPNYFCFYYKNSSRLVNATDPKDVWRCMGVAKYTDTAKALKEWAVEMVEATLPKPELDMDQIKTEGFGPEAHVEDDDPTANTKMIT